MTTPTAHILVVDDDEPNRDILSRRLTRAGHRVSTAASGQEALDFLASHRVDLIMLDVQMPGMSGFDVLREIRQSSSLSGVPVVLVTARALGDDVEAGFALGADDYVTKPVDFAAVLAAIHNHLQRKPGD